MRCHPRAFMLTVAGLAAWTASTPSQAASTPDLDQLTTQQAAADICAGKITSTALVSAAIARAQANSNLNAFITLDEPGAMKAAEAFDASRKKRTCEPLGGVPVVIKDNIEVVSSVQRRHVGAQGFRAEEGRAGGGKTARGRGDHHRKDKYARTCLRHFRIQRSLQDRQ